MRKRQRLRLTPDGPVRSALTFPFPTPSDDDIVITVHYVYLVRCADDSLYTGYARDPHEREQVHNAGRGAKYTCGRRPVKLVYTERFDLVGDALRRERQLKRWSRVKKEALVRKNPF